MSSAVRRLSKVTSSRRLLPTKASRSTLDRTISVKVFAQGGQRVAGVRKGGPVGDRPGETLGVRRRDTDPQFLTEQAGTQDSRRNNSSWCRRVAGEQAVVPLAVEVMPLQG